MKTMKHLMAAMASMLMIISSSAQTPVDPLTDPYGTAKYGCVWGGPVTDQKISGTLNALSLTLFMQPNADPQATPVVTSVIPVSLRVKIGTWLVINDTTFPDLMEYLPTVRFSTMSFLDGADIVIDVEIKFNCVIASVPPSTVQRTFHREFKPKSYQKLQTLGNNRKYVNGVPQYDAEFEADSNATTTRAKTDLTPPHTTLPGPIAQAETKASILDKIVAHTVFVASTHGQGNTIDDSDSSEQVLLVAPGQPPAIDSIKKRTALKADAGIPVFNFVAIYACRTGEGNIQEAFGFPVAGSAAAAFQTDVSMLCFTPEEWATVQGGTPVLPTKKLNDHANILFLKLKSGWTVEQALASANSLIKVAATGTVFPPIGSPMVLQGDKNCRLKFVYLSTPEWASGMNPDIEWIRVDTAGGAGGGGNR